MRVAAIVACLLSLTVAASSSLDEEATKAPSFIFDGDVPYDVPTSKLSSILTCPYGINAASKPVLLVHGTGSKGSESWGDGYVPALKADGYTPCFVDLPVRALQDMQRSSAFVAYNLHYVSHLASGAKVAAIGHSQGNPDIQWALNFFPSTRKVTRAFVGLSPEFSGVRPSAVAKMCRSMRGCQASVWQQLAGSHYYSALKRQAHAALVPTTMVWSGDDGVVYPFAKNAQLAKAAVLSVQELCPGRKTSHFQMITDAAAYAIAKDALDNEGLASLGRLKKHAKDTCSHEDAPGMDSSMPSKLQAKVEDIVLGFVLTGQRLPAEPPVKPYAMKHMR